MSQEKLWSVWQRSKAIKGKDTFAGSHTTVDGQGNIIAKFRWVGRVAWGWYTPLSAEQANEATQKAVGVVSQTTNSMTQPMPKNK